ncbi:MAG: endonuclease domain-containing protein [Alphaproteobacteria bacterium]|nr:endonuclease domain-containing protein [Alphaproteobacteria bacterium]
MASLSKDIKAHAREMRREPTDAERKLWSLLRHNQLCGLRFRRQHPIPPYIVDFAFVEVRVIVEADGGQHAESGYDQRRDQFLAQGGWQVLRFWNNDILSNSEGVAETIIRALERRRHPLPDPPPAEPGEGVDSGIAQVRPERIEAGENA